MKEQQSSSARIMTLISLVITGWLKEDSGTLNFSFNIIKYGSNYDLLT